jgi:glutathione peroxidase
MRPCKTILSLLILAALSAMADSTSNIVEIPLKDIDGKDTTLKAQKARVMLVVNVASKCGLTPQYTALEKLHRSYRDRGFSVVGIPSNDFGNQEPGTPAEIKEFCSSMYDVTFPLMGKIHVKGDEQHPLYTALTGKNAAFPGDIEWNFGKFLVTTEGTVLKRFSPRTAPDDPEVIKAIEDALAKS